MKPFSKGYIQNYRSKYIKQNITELSTFYVWPNMRVHNCIIMLLQILLKFYLYKHECDTYVLERDQLWVNINQLLVQRHSFELFLEFNWCMSYIKTLDFRSILFHVRINHCSKIWLGNLEPHDTATYLELTMSITIFLKLIHCFRARFLKRSAFSSCNNLKATAKWWFSSTEESLYISASSLPAEKITFKNSQ